MQALADWHVFVDPDALVVLGLLGSCDFLSCRADAVPQGRTVIAEREVPDVRGIERKRLGTRAIGGGAPDIDPAVQHGAVVDPVSVRRPDGEREHGKPRRITQRDTPVGDRSEEHTSALQSLMRNSYAGFCFK